MPDPHRHRRPPRLRPPHPASPRVANRAAAVLGAIESLLVRLDARPMLADLPMFPPLRAEVEALLATAERATARHTGPAWRQRWHADLRLTRRRAKLELQMASAALIATLAADLHARPPGPPRHRSPDLSPPPPTHGISMSIRHRDGGRDERPVVERKPGGSPSGGPRDWTTG